MSNRSLESLKATVRRLHNGGVEKTPNEVAIALRNVITKLRNFFKELNLLDDEINAMNDEEFGDAFGVALIILMSLQDLELFTKIMREYAKLFPIVHAAVLSEFSAKLNLNKPEHQHFAYKLSKVRTLKLLRGD